MAAQGWIVLGFAVLAALYFARNALRDLTRKPGGSHCGGCSGSCGEKPVSIRPGDERKV